MSSSSMRTVKVPMSSSSNTGFNLRSSALSLASSPKAISMALDDRILTEVNYDRLEAQSRRKWLRDHDRLHAFLSHRAPG